MAGNDIEAPELLSALAEEMSENPGMRFVDTLDELSEWYGAGEPELKAAARFAAGHPGVAASIEIYDPASEPEFILAAYPGLVDELADLSGALRPDLARALAQEPDAIVEPLASVGDSPAALEAREAALAAAMAALGRAAFEGDAAWACRITESGPGASGAPEWAVFGGEGFEPSLSEFVERNAAVHSGVDLVARGDAQVDVVCRGPIKAGAEGPVETATLIEMRPLDFGSTWALTQYDDGPDPREIEAAFSDSRSLRPAGSAIESMRAAATAAAGHSPISGAAPRAKEPGRATPRADRAQSRAGADRAQAESRRAARDSGVIGK